MTPRQLNLMESGADDHPQIDIEYLAVSGVDVDAAQFARQRFEKRYGQTPDVIVVDRGLTLAGPVPQAEATL